MTAGEGPPETLSEEVESNPAVSIVVCFYNNIEITIRCVNSVRRNTRAGQYELLLIDDGSDDPAAHDVAELDGVRLIRSEENQGFTLSANLGARHATGEFLVVLNNDTEVQPGWLDALLDAARSGPDVGAVGAMLISPDGMLEEAGGIIWSDATGLNYGRGRDPSNAEYQYRREVDYCSGACLLLRRELFEKAGGFDECFSPGFYEDTDLCFTLRSSGYAVLYEPSAQVIHIGGATFGSEEHVGASARHSKSGQYLNRLIFQAKWADELLHHYPPGTAGGMRGGRVPDRCRVLVSDFELAQPDQSSGALRMAWIVRLLHELGCEVTLFPLDRVERQPYADWLSRTGIETYCNGTDLTGMAEGRPGLYDLVILSRPQVARTERQTVRLHFPQALLVYDAVDLYFLREERQLALDPPKGDPEVLEHAFRRARRRELDEIRAADIVSTVTEAEATLVRSLVPEQDVVLLPNVHAVRSTDIPGFEDRAGLLFIGGYRHAPNVDAVRWFCSEILPSVRRNEPAHFVALGSDPPPDVEALASDIVDVPGYLKSVTSHFDQARVFVAPLRYGAGMKGKIGMAMAMGLPVVTTSIGAEGMGLIDGVHVLVADDPLAFADAVLRLYRDGELWSSLSIEARQLARQEWSPQMMKEKLTDLMQRTRAGKSMVPRTWGRLDPEGILERTGH
jgi:GT2 family glycosyltransferase